jgi:hypothetical protein
VLALLALVLFPVALVVLVVVAVIAVPVALVAAGIGLVAIAGVIAAWFAWFRRPAWSAPEPWTTSVDEAEQATLTIPTDSGLDTPATGRRGAAGAISSEATIETTGSAPYPIEEA